MGNSCCRTESPCGSAEERSGLLKDDPKVTAVVGGAYNAENHEHIRKTSDDADIKGEEVEQVKQEVVQVKQEIEPLKQEVQQVKQEVVQVKQEVVQVKPEVEQVKQEVVQVKQEVVQVKQEVVQVKQENLQAKPEVIQVKQEVEEVKQEVEEVKQEVEPGITLENGPLSKGSEVTGNPSRDQEVDLKDPPPAQLLLCTFTSQQEQNAASDWAVFTTTEEEEEKTTTPASSGQDTIPACNSPTAKSHVERNTLDAPPDPDPEPPESPEPKASWEFAPNNGESHVPNPEICPATRRTPPNLVVSEDRDPESPSRAQAEDSQNSRVQNGHDPGPDPEKPKPDRSSEAKCVRDPDASDSSNKPEVELVATSSLKDPEPTKTRDEDEGEPKVKEEEEEEEEEDEAPPEKKEEEEQPSREMKNEEDDLENSDEDLYRGADELSSLQKTKHPLEGRCSLAPAVDIVSYSEREWRGNTAKSALIRKGYLEMSQRFSSVRRVRGDNYCALRATLFQLLVHSTQLPDWLQDDDAADTLLQRLDSVDGLMSLWTFPGDDFRGDGASDVSLKLKAYMELLRNKWRSAVACSSSADRRLLVEESFLGGEEELGLLEALKLLMLSRAVELHGLMTSGNDVPLFCWLLFARDSSSCPKTFLSNHLSLVGLSAGLEQVEMFLLGDALQVTLQVYRLYKADTEEFITYYPDHGEGAWPLISLVTEDDRHYNVPVRTS